MFSYNFTILNYYRFNLANIGNYFITQSKLLHIYAHVNKKDRPKGRNHHLADLLSKP